MHKITLLQISLCYTTYLSVTIINIVSLRAARNQKLQMKGANTKHK